MDDLKRLIRSLLISSPLQSEVWSLAKDYEEMNGEPIPYKSFGFKTLEDFLRSIPDVVEVCGSGKNAKLKVLANSKTMHIDKLVSKQKLPESRRKKSRQHVRRQSAIPRGLPAQNGLLPIPYRINFPPPSHMIPYNAAPHMVVNYFLDRPNEYLLSPTGNVPPRHNLPPNCRNSPPEGNSVPKCDLQRKGGAPQKQDLLPKDTSSVPCKTPFRATSSPLSPKGLPSSKIAENQPAPIPSNLPQQLSPNDLHKDKHLPQSRNINEKKLQSSFQSHLNGEHSGVISKKANSMPSPHASCSNFDDEIYISDKEGYLSDENFSPDHQEDDIINYNVPFVVQNNLRKLISQHQNGIWCAEMPEVYKKMFKKPLEYTDYGYRTLIQMCMSLETIFHCYRPYNGDFLLFDKTKPIPCNVLQDSQQAAAFKSKVDYKIIENPTEPAIIDAEEFVRDTLVANYPPGVMQLGEEISRQFLSDDIVLVEDEPTYIDVVVGEVYDPSKFWILLKDTSEQLDSLMDEMQLFYMSAPSSFEIPVHMLYPGLYCAAKYNNEYHRAVIVSLPPDKAKIKVFYADYGTLSTIEWKGVMFLHRKFTDLPLQAIRARLASIWPPTAYSPWSVDASSRLLSLVRCKDLVAHIHRIHRDKQIVEIFLVDTSTNEDIYMNDTLVAEGYALFTNQKQQKKPLHPRRIPKYKHIHLFPTFEDLEKGNVPSAAEVVRLYRYGVQSEYVFPDYYVEVVDKQSLLMDLDEEEFLKHERQLLANIDKFNLSDDKFSTNVDDIRQESSVSTTTWLELIDEELESKTSSNSEKKRSTSSPSEEPDSSLECLFSPGHQVLATPAVKPPPGFENVKPVNSDIVKTKANSLLLGSHPNTTAPPVIVTQPVVMTDQPVAFVAQQVIEPASLLGQNETQNTFIRQVELSRMITQQPDAGGNNWNQPYQNVLIRQQNQLLIGQQNATFVGQSNPSFVAQSNACFVAQSNPCFAAQSNPCFPTQSNPCFTTQSNPSFASQSNPSVLNSSFMGRPNPSLVGQQNPLLFAQQQTPLMVQQQIPWINQNPSVTLLLQDPATNRQHPGLNCLSAAQRQQLQKFVHKWVAAGNMDMLIHLESMLKLQMEQKEGMLFRIIWKVLSTRTTLLSLQELEMVIDELLNMLSDYQIVELSARHLEKSEEQNRTHDVTLTSVTPSTTSVKDSLMKLMSEMALGSEKTSVHGSDENNKQTDVEEENKKNMPRRRCVVKADLENQPVHVIQFKNDLYVPVNDILQFTKIKPPIDKIRKMIVMMDPTKSVAEISVNEHKNLAEELARYKILDSIVYGVPVACVPKIVDFLGSEEKVSNKYSEFLKAVNINSELWLTS